MQTKSWYQSKTIWLAIAQAVAGVLVVVYAQNPALGTVGFGAIVKSFLDIYIRYTTVAPMQ